LQRPGPGGEDKLNGNEINQRKTAGAGPCPRSRSAGGAPVPVIRVPFAWSHRKHLQYDSAYPRSSMPPLIRVNKDRNWRGRPLLVRRPAPARRVDDSCRGTVAQQSPWQA
jgi:hypothetical protein